MEEVEIRVRIKKNYRSEIIIEPVRTEYCIDVAIQGLEEYKKKSKERQIATGSENNINGNRS